MELYLFKNLNGTFTPCHSSDHDKAKKLKAGEEYLCKVTRPRNIKFHRKYFALLNLAFDNQDQFSVFDRFREAVTIAAGYTERKGHLDGTTRLEAKSISFGSMDEDEFIELYSSTLDVIIKVLGVTSHEIEQNIQEFF